jgi:hypothetical protein
MNEGRKFQMREESSREGNMKFVTLSLIRRLILCISFLRISDDMSCVCLSYGYQATYVVFIFLTGNHATYLVYVFLTDIRRRVLCLSFLRISDDDMSCVCLS